MRLSKLCRVWSTPRLHTVGDRLASPDLPSQLQMPLQCPGAAALRVFKATNRAWVLCAGTVHPDHVEGLRSADRAHPWACRCSLTLVLLLSVPS